MPLYQTCLPYSSNFITAASSSLNFTSRASTSTTSLSTNPSTPATLEVKEELLSTVYLEPSLHLRALCYALFLLHILPFTGLSNTKTQNNKSRNHLIFRPVLVLCAHFHRRPGQLCTNTSKLGVLDSSQLGLLGVRTANKPRAAPLHPDAELDQLGQVAVGEGNGEPAGLQTVEPSSVNQVQTLSCVCIAPVQVTILNQGSDPT